MKNIKIKTVETGLFLIIVLYAITYILSIGTPYSQRELLYIMHFNQEWFYFSLVTLGVLTTLVNVKQGYTYAIAVCLYLSPFCYAIAYGINHSNFLSGFLSVISHSFEGRGTQALFEFGVPGIFVWCLLIPSLLIFLKEQDRAKIFLFPSTN